MSKHQPNLIFLIETKTHQSRLEVIKKKLGFEGLFAVEGRNNRGGLALRWKRKIDVKLLSFSSNHIDVETTSTNGNS